MGREGRVDERADLRLLVCGSVDDGKSTLIGRLLLDTGQALEDQLEALEVGSRVHGPTEGGLYSALLTDGLNARCVCDVGAESNHGFAVN